MTPLTVITPVLYGARAVELGNRVWKKRILPIGDVAYQGRTLHFTRDYLATLADAFRNRAYDQVPFQLADASNGHTQDPERYRGHIRDLELADDGLYVTAEVTPAGERVLSENPQLGVSARIVEHYQRSDGRHFPAAIQHVLGTLDPRIPQLGPWQAVEMSNGGPGQLVIDLSQSSWAGEPGMPFADAARALAARLPQRQDANDLDAVIAATLPAGYAPQADGYELANAYGEFSQAFEFATAAEQQRQAEDAAPPARRAEDRISAALGRIGRGTFTPQGMHAVGLANAPAPGNCGPADPFGRCSERYHDHGCASSAETGLALAFLEDGTYADRAARPVTDARGLTWADREFGTPMSWTDMLEASTGQRLAT